jgi:hypothetical protein
MNDNVSHPYKTTGKIIDSKKIMLLSLKSKLLEINFRICKVVSEEQSPTRRVLIAVLEGRRQRGRPKLRWEDGVLDDARKMEERNWRNAARNRDSWQKLLRKALAQKGLLCQ